MLDRIGDMLDEAQIRYARLDGTMTREDRAKACDSLRHNKKTEVLLVSTRAGGVGLNLTAASRCFLVDPYWNPSVEAQAIDRIVCPNLQLSSTSLYFPLLHTVSRHLPHSLHYAQCLVSFGYKRSQLTRSSIEWVKLGL